MTFVSRTTALLACVAACACAGADDPPAIDLGEADDRLGAFDKEIELVEPTEIEIEGSLRVVKKEGPEAGLIVNAPLYVLDVPERGTMHVKVTTVGFVDWFTDDMEFMMLVEDDTGSWVPANIIMEYMRDQAPTISKLEFFDEITYTPSRDRLVAEHNAVGELTDEGVGLEGVERIGIFVVPAQAWGQSIRGDYDFVLEASCSGRPCRIDAGDDDSGNEPQEPEEEPENDGGNPLSVSIHGDGPSSSHTFSR